MCTGDAGLIPRRPLEEFWLQPTGTADVYLQARLVALLACEPA
jgi:hypothetical protein